MIVLDKEKDKLEKMAVSLFRKIKPIANLMSSMAKRNEITDHFFFFEAPKVILVASKDHINAALAAQNMEFVAEAYGLGVLYSGFFTMAANHSRQIKKQLDLPKGQKLVTALVMGYKSSISTKCPKRKIKYQIYVRRNKHERRLSTTY